VLLIKLTVRSLLH